jgi:rhodanese-related sulfurtransferase
MALIQEKIAEIDVRQLAGQLARSESERPHLLDVREAQEFALVRLPDAQLIPLGELAARLDEVPAGREVVVYCHHGIRSLSGAAILEAAGRKASSLRGGIDAWARLIDPKLPRY